jgi:hydrogenase expression/formation protein HypC
MPARVEETMGESRAMVRLGGVVQEVSTLLLEDVRPGEYVIVHVGFALARVDPDEALRTLSLMDEMSGKTGGS